MKYDAKVIDRVVFSKHTFKCVEHLKVCAKLVALQLVAARGKEPASCAYRLFQSLKR